MKRLPPRTGAVSQEHALELLAVRVFASMLPSRLRHHPAFGRRFGRREVGAFAKSLLTNECG
jgi:hypothetical protein